jgi:hypothetical protein
MRSEASTDVRNLHAPGRAQRTRVPGAPSGVVRRIAGTLAMATFLGLSSGPAVAGAAQAQLDDTDAQFMAFLEYLGSWDGAEEEWTELIDYVEPAEPGASVAPEEARVDTVLSFTGRVPGR